MGWGDGRGGEKGRLQQVHPAVVQQVCSALRRLLHHVVLVDYFHSLVVDAQPAVQTNVEDICSVMAACCTVSVVIDNWRGNWQGKTKSDHVIDICPGASNRAHQIETIRIFH